MEVTLGSGFRITIPREIREKLQLKEGTKLTMNIQDDKIILDFNSIIENKIPEKKEQKVKSQNESKKLIGVRQIVSNLEEGKNFTNKVYSDCGLVIRTKRSYMNQFCDDCQGQLALEYGVLDHPCKYINIPERIETEEPKKEKPKPIKNIVQKLADNVKKLDKTIDTKIDKIEKEYP